MKFGVLGLPVSWEKWSGIPGILFPKNQFDFLLLRGKYEAFFEKIKEFCLKLILDLHLYGEKSCIPKVSGLVLKP